MQFQLSASRLLPPSWQAQTPKLIGALGAAVLMRAAGRRCARGGQ